MFDKLKFLGSTVAIILGVLYFLGGISQLVQGGSSAGVIIGPVMVLGAIAYRSRKRRLMGLKSSSFKKASNGSIGSWDCCHSGCTTT